MHAKINRKNAEQIDIGAICMQILQPQVPLALRLSGILMGGIVMIYQRKVSILYDDVNEFLVKINTSLVTKFKDKTSLPKGRTHARFDNVTIQYNFDEIPDIERLMMRPSTPGKEQEDEQSEQFFIVRNMNASRCANFHGRDPFQVDNDDITLAVDHTGFPKQAFNDLDPDFQEVRIPLPDPMETDDFFPDIQLSDESPPEVGQGNKASKEKQQPENPSPEEQQHVQGPDSPEPEVIPPALWRRRLRRKTARSSTFDDKKTAIPAHIFEMWLQDPSDLVGRSLQITKDVDAKRVEKLLDLPSTGISMGLLGPEPLWTSEIHNLWKLALTRRRKTRQRNVRKENIQHENGTSGPSDSGHPEEEGNSPSPDKEVVPERVVVLDSTDIGDYGSVEKLRTAVRTPSTGSQEGFWPNQIGLTPRRSGQLDASVRRSNRRRSSPPSGQLLFDNGGEPSFIGRFKKPRLSQAFRKSISPAFVARQQTDMLKDTNDIPRSQDGERLLGSLSQFELLEETEASQAANPHDSIDRLTSNILRHLREISHARGGVQLPSVDTLAQGFNRTQAAKLFYRICVLASNHYVMISQPVPYGDITLKRGPYL